MLKNYPILLVLFLVCSCPGLKSQGITTYNISDGLAHNHIRYIYQDSKDFIWIGTWDGISRFDGHHFTSFHHIPDDSTSIFNEELSWITEDSAGKIWAYTNQGIMNYAGGENFNRVFLDEEHKTKIRPLGHQSLIFDIFGQGWFIDNQGVYTFSDDLRSIRKLDFSDGFLYSGSTLLADNGGLWFVASAGLCYFRYNTLETTHILSMDNADIFVSASDVNRDLSKGFLKKVDDRILVLFSKHGIFEVDKDAQVLKQLLGNNIPGVDERVVEFRRFSEISSGIIAFGNGKNDVLIYDLNNMKIIDEHPLLQYTCGRDIQTVISDNQHNIWVGGITGVSKYKQPQLNFRSWVFDPENQNTLAGENLTHVFKDRDGYLWISSVNGGIERVNPKNGLATKINLPHNFSGYTDPKRGNYVYQLDGQTFLLAYDSAIFTYHLDRNTFEFITKVNRHVRQIAKDENGRLYAIASSGLYVLRYTNGGLEVEGRFDGNPEDNQFESNWDVEIIDDRLFLGQEKGLTIIDKNNLSDYECFVPGGVDKAPYVLCVCPVRNGLIWIGTLRSGIYAFDMAEKEFVRHFDMDSGLIDNSVNAIFEDDSGFLWASTWKGIAKVDPVTGEIKNYSTVNGLPFSEFNTQVYCKDDSGNFYFGGIGGVIEMNPETFVNFDIPDKLHVVEFHAGNKLLPLNNPLKRDEVVTLDYDQNDFSVLFSSFDFRHPEQRRYRYKLNGYDTKWRQLASNKYDARYSNIAPGLYALTVGSAYENWPWVGEHTRLMIRIKPPPLFQRQSFQVGIFIVLGLLVVAIIFLRMRNVNMKKEMMITRLEKESSLAKLNFLKSQMNPHFYFNTLNAINSFVLKHEIREANLYLTKFAKLMREILDNSQKEFVKISEEKAVLEKYLVLQQLRFRDLFDFEINIDPELEEKVVPPMFLQPFIENSVEYAFVEMKEKGWLQINFKQDGRCIICSVNDNGIGIDSSVQIKRRSKRKSTAIKNIYKRIEMLNNIYDANITLEITKRNPENNGFPGTRIVLKMPDFLTLVKTGL